MRGKQKGLESRAAWLFAPIWAGDATELGKSVWRCRLGWLDAGAWIWGGDEGVFCSGCGGRSIQLIVRACQWPEAGCV